MYCDRLGHCTVFKLVPLVGYCDLTSPLVKWWHVLCREPHFQLLKDNNKKSTSSPESLLEALQVNNHLKYHQELLIPGHNYDFIGFIICYIHCVMCCWHAQVIHIIWFATIITTTIPFDSNTVNLTTSYGFNITTVWIGHCSVLLPQFII